ncbi:MAG: pyruvate formate lyase-activating protein [Clostridia bacterium]|nr:pyruvate formate lyase-activating protein [Clostridia bacterium]
MTGHIHSFQSLGTVDGPGVRFVVFLQGCPLRCGCCHNPDTWELQTGKVFSSEQVLEKILRCRDYFGKEGGVTLSGGEPLLQAAFARELFSLCKEAGIHTCLDTSGCIWNQEVASLLKVTDLVLLDIKYTDEEDYRRYVGCSMEQPLRFLAELDKRGIPTTLRQVIIPTLNDTEENILRLKAMGKSHSCVEKTELLPFRKICESKYNSMGIPFPFAQYETPAKEKMNALQDLLGVL